MRNVGTLKRKKMRGDDVVDVGRLQLSFDRRDAAEPGEPHVISCTHALAIFSSHSRRLPVARRMRMESKRLDLSMTFKRLYLQAYNSPVSSRKVARTKTLKKMRLATREAFGFAGLADDGHCGRLLEKRAASFLHHEVFFGRMQRYCLTIHIVLLAVIFLLGKSLATFFLGSTGAMGTEGRSTALLCRERKEMSERVSRTKT